ncbi:aminotransferase class V-fold PLP-dependent enzyme [Paenibacillus sp.]|uniref:aminotransferase class V-fold PLP-dependent enzyme n=1 Tax=Paenibacillus sp. TaxID=58172 RepID=UPI002D410C1C|nr:aminotransferase class V-fold PLP-dependent enzyme [Paenibacillus sp.]HZG57757.1 aminotransferase class V-fold PLP-dependent enzyme [Paenibacillus sp.]
MPTATLTETKTSAASAVDWEQIRAQFNLDPDYIHMGTAQYFASHPRHVREAIEKHRDELDKNPAVYILKNEVKFAEACRKAAANYFGVDDHKRITLVDSTTVGLGIVYTGLNIQAGREILTSEHNYYSQQEAIKQAADRTGCTFREVKYYEDIHTVTIEEMVGNLVREITDRTRVVGATWVHSSTGLKSPIPQLAKEIAKLNEKRSEEDRILLVVDGVHGFGVELETFPELGCDFFCAGTHKWIYGPRGTGIVAGTEAGYRHVRPVIPSFSETMYEIISGKPKSDVADGTTMSPGGFHSMEHLWAMPAGFEFSLGIGKQAVYERVHGLARMLKEGLADMPHVLLATPMDDALSSGIVSFEVKGMSPKETAQALVDKKVISTEAPYKKRYARFTPGVYISEADVKKALDAVMSLKR